MTREEYIKRRNKREGETSSLSSSKNAYQRYAERKTSGIIEDAYSKGTEALNNIYSGWNSAEDFSKNQQTALESLKAMEDAKNRYGIDTYDNVLKNYADNLKGMKSAGETYSKYVSKNAYDSAVRDYEISNKYKNASYEDIQNALKTVTDAHERDYLKRYTDYSSLEDFDKAIEAEEAERVEAQKSFKGKLTNVHQEKLKEAKDIYQKTHAFDEYKYLMDQEDYAEKSKDSAALERYELGVATDPLRLLKRGNVAFSDSLSDEQRAMAAYLFNRSEGEYLDYMKKMTYMARLNEAAEMQKETSEFAKEHPVAASVMYPTFDTLMGGLAGVESLVSIANGETAPTAMQNLVYANSQSIGEMSQAIKDKKGMIPGFAYDVFTTEVPNRLGQMLFGSAYNVVMGLQSFANTYADEINRGTPSGTALLNALVGGGLETLTEMVGMEWAFGESKGAIETVLKQAFAEGSEEVVSSLANLVYDINVNGGESDYYQNINKYMAMGLSADEAKKRANIDYIKEVAHQFGVAAFSTLPTGGVQQIARVSNESKMGEFIDREKLNAVGSEELFKKYGEEWSQKASNREVYKAYDKYVTDTKTKATETEKAESVKALMAEYNLSEEEATKYIDALYDGTNQKILKTHFGSVIKEEADNGTGWAAKADFSESSKYVDNLTQAADMLMSEDQVKANKAQKNLKVGEKNTVNGKEAEIISMKANKDGTYTVKTSMGEVDSKEITVTENKAKALSYSADIANETLKEAFVHYYAGEDIADYDQYVRTAYEAGINSLDLSEFPSIIDGLGKAKAMAFYNLGAEKTLREELATEEALDKVTKAIKSTGKFESGAFVDGKFKKDDNIFRNLNRTQKKLYKVVEAFSKLSGVNVRVFSDRSAASKNGEFVADSKGGWISINLAARPYGDSLYGINSYVVSTLSHELTHWLKANNEEAYNILENAIVETLTEKGTLEKYIKNEQDSYQKVEGKELSREVALEEVVARACEDMLNNTETMAEVLSHTDMNGLERLKAAFEEWFKHIKEFFDELMSGFSSPNEITQSLTQEYEELRKIWVKGINDAINMKKSGQQSSEKKVASAKASIKLTTDNKQAVVVSDDILSNVAQDKWVETVKNALFSHEIKVPHDVIKVNSLTRKEYTYSEYTRYLKRKEGTKYYDKLRAAKYIDEVVEASFGYVNEESKHNNFDTFSRGNVLLDIGGNQYSAEVVIGINQKKEMVFYDIVNIVPTSFQYKRTITSDESQRDVSQKGYRSLENNITQTDSNVKNSVKLSEREEKALDTLNVEVEGSYAYPKFNLKTFRESDYNKNIDVAAAALAKKMEISVEEAKKYIKDVGSIANIIAKDRERLDYIAIEGKSAWVSNPEYGGSLDYSFLCPKRLTYTGTMNAILRKQNDLIFSVDDFLWLRKALITAGYEAPCSYCFVESARARFGKYNKQFLDIAKAENLSYIPTAEDLTNPDKLEEMREKHPETYNRYEKFLNSLSQRKPKMLEERRAYNGDILKAFQGKEDTIKDKNLHGGIRFNSFSDFEIVHMLDCMQAIMDMSRVGLAGFGYTKQKAFVEIFGKTGLKINMSCMAKGVEADGKHVVFDDIEGMNHNDALKLRNGNVGIVCVVFNDVQLRAALCDERIDYVLPFHRSQWSKADYEKMGLSLDTKDYTRPQTEKLGTKKAKEGNIPFLSYWNANQTGTETVQRYLDIINEQGKTPIFPVVLEKVDGKWVMPKGIKKNGKFINKTEEIKEKAAENYWKLLTEAKMYNNDGTPIGQTAVTPNFNMKAARELLKKYDGSHKEFPVAQNVVDDFLEYKKTGETKNFEWKRNSNKMDSEGKTLTEDQVKYFKDSKIRDDKGNLLVMYHGTEEGGFTVFDASYSDDKLSLFFTDNKNVAMTYVDEYPSDYNPYLRRKKIETADDAVEYLKSAGWKIILSKKNEDGSITWTYQYPGGFQITGDTDGLIKHAKVSQISDHANIYPLYINIKNPYVVDANGSNFNRLLLNEDAKKSDEAIVKVAQFMNSISLYFENDTSLEDLAEEEGEGSWDEWLNYILEEAEHDGIYSNELLTNNLHKLAQDIDKISSNWDSSKHLDKEGNPLNFIDYLMDASFPKWKNTRDIAKYAKEHGYDGVFFKNIVDIANGHEYINASNIAVAFNSEQVKSIYNEHPTTDKDIRKSEKMSYDELSEPAKERIRELEEEVGKLTDENAALRAEKLMEKNKAEKKVMVDRITEQAKILSRWLLENDKQNPVPQSVRIPLGKFLTSIDYTKDSYEWRKSHGLLTKSDETLGTRMAKISQMLLDLDQDKAVDKDAYDMSQLDWIPEFTNEFAKIKDTIAAVESKEGERFSLGKMNHDDLQDLLNLITALKTSIINMNKCLSAHNKIKVDIVGKQVIDHLDRIGQKDKDGDIRQWLEVSNTTPYYFFQRLGFGGEQTFRLLMDGMNKYAFEAKQIKDYAEETFKGKDVKAWRDDVKTFEVEEFEVKTERKEGEMPLEHKLRTIQMTVPQIMSLYCLQKRDQAMNHIKTGGIKVGTFETKADGKKVKVRQIENVTLTEKDLNNILSVLTDEQKEVADKLQHFMNTVCQQWGNEVTMKRFGYKGMTEKNYFPISVDRNQLSSEARQKGTSLYQLLNMGFTKAINPNAKNPIEVFDIFETFTIHATEMAQYNSLALPVLDVIKIWNYKEQELLDEEENKAHWHSVKGSIESVLGEKANGYIGRLLADLNGDVTGGRADSFAKKLMKNYKTAAVAANLQVAFLQPLSYIRAGYMVDSKYLTKGFAMKSDNEMALKYCGIAVWKDMGFYNTAINTGLEHMIMQDDTKKDKIIEKSLFLAGKMDEWTWGKLWNACLLETKDKYPTLEGKELYERTGERLTEVIYGTQVVDSILTRSDLMRDQTFYTSMVTAFQAEPTLSLNILMDAAVRFDQEKRASGTQAALRVHGEKIKRAALVYLISSAVESALRAVIGKIRNYDGDEDDEKLIEDFFKRFIEELNPLRKIPLIREIFDILIQAVTKGKIYTDTRLDEAIFENIGKSAIRIKRIIQGGDFNYKHFNEILKGIDATGLPVSSFTREIKVIWNNTIGRIWNSLLIK